jgi:mono/diheme cytochrome c family protein
MIRHLPLAALLLATPALGEEAMKPGPGQDAVTVTCGICHTLGYIRMNSTFLTPDGWKAEVAKMRDAYGAPVDDDTANTIVKYLSTTYGAPAKS